MYEPGGSTTPFTLKQHFTGADPSGSVIQINGVGDVAVETTGLAAIFLLPSAITHFSKKRGVNRQSIISQLAE
jgi:hypothetical protein